MIAKAMTLMTINGIHTLFKLTEKSHQSISIRSDGIYLYYFLLLRFSRVYVITNEITAITPTNIKILCV